MLFARSNGLPKRRTSRLNRMSCADLSFKTNLRKAPPPAIAQPWRALRRPRLRCRHPRLTVPVVHVYRCYPRYPPLHPLMITAQINTLSSQSMCSIFFTIHVFVNARSVACLCHVTSFLSKKGGESRVSDHLHHHANSNISMKWRWRRAAFWILVAQLLMSMLLCSGACGVPCCSRLRATGRDDYRTCS